MTHLTQSLSFVTDYTYRIITWFEELVVEYKKARDVAETINELNKLSDAELRDIGISRVEIYKIARKSYLGERS
jgi:uncharacterized protein YjiS (DUF1127 family)